MKIDKLTVDSHYSNYINYAAECCNNFQFKKRLDGTDTESGKILSKYRLCPYCKKPLVFGYAEKEENIRKCALKHVGKILSMFNRVCRLKKKFGVRFQEVGKLYNVRVFKNVYSKEANYFIVSFEEPEMTGSIMHFYKGYGFRKYFEFVD